MGNESSQYGKKIENDIVIKWERDSGQCPFSPREGQAATVVGSKLFLFGGVVLLEGVDESMDSESDELLVYDLLLKKWSKEICSGFCPGKRSGASLTSINKRLYLFGGLSQTTGWMNDLFVYDTDSKVWKEISAPNAPSPRDKVTSASVGSKIYVFGGFGPVEEEANDISTEEEDDDDEYEDVDELEDIRDCQEAINFTWSDQLFVFDTIRETWSLIKSEKNNGPSPRAAHTLTYLKDSSGTESLFVFGGRDMESRQNDLWKFNISLDIWEECKGLGCPPKPRSFHASTSVGSRLIIFGGRAVNNEHFNDLHIFDTGTNEWLQPHLVDTKESSGDAAVAPPQMGMHSLCTVCECVVLYGGSSTLDPATGTCTEFHSDVYVIPMSNVLKGSSLDVKSMKVNEANPSSVPGLLGLKSSDSSAKSNTN